MSEEEMLKAKIDFLSAFQNLQIPVRKEYELDDEIMDMHVEYDFYCILREYDNGTNLLNKLNQQISELNMNRDSIETSLFNNYHERFRNIRQEIQEYMSLLAFVRVV